MRFLCSLVLVLAPISAVYAQDEASEPAAESIPATEPEAASEPEMEEINDRSPATTPPLHETNSAENKGLLGPVRIGATVAAPVIPHLANISIEVMYKDSFSGGLSFGRFKHKFEDVEVEMRNWDLRGRWHPFEGSFFLGAAYGNQGLVGKMEKDLKTKLQGVELKVPTTLKLDVDTTYLTPHLGWFAVWDSGFTMGFELGYQIALSSSASLDTAFENTSASSESALKESAEYKKNKKDVEDLAKTLGETSVPYITLLRLGWMF